MLPKWDKKYSVHNFLIDSQHKKLFELANAADNLIGKQVDSMEIKKMLFALFDYMKHHFHDEEVYMESIKYPGLQIHREHHRNIVSEMTVLVKNMKYDFKQQLAIITEQWLLKHILREDMRIGEYQQEMLEKKRLEAKQHNLEQDNILENSFIESAESIQGSSENSAQAHIIQAIKKDSVLHIYSCMCGKVYNISSNVHNKIQNGHPIRCKYCNTNISYINDMRV